MLRSLVVANACLLVACTDDGVDPGRLIVSCTECGPGALATGRFVEADIWRDHIAASASGHIVRAGRGYVAWLDDRLAPARMSRLDSDHGSLDANNVAVAEDGSVLVIASWYDDFDAQSSLIAFDPNGVELWRRELGPTNIQTIAIGNGLVFLGARAHSRLNYGGASLHGSWIAAIDRSSGALAWSATWPEASVGGIDWGTRLAPLPDGGVAIGGAFAGTLALDGTSPLTTTSTTYAGFVAALDANGRARWARLLESDRGNVMDLATSPAGDIAIAGAWHGEATIGGTALPVPFADGTQGIVLLGSDGNVRWSQPLGRVFYDFFRSLVTDGTTVWAGGTYGPDPLTFDAAKTRGVDTDAWVAALDGTATPPRWLRFARGFGTQMVELHAITGDRIIATIDSLASSPDPEDDTVAAMTLGDVAVTGDGYLIAELVRD